MISKKTILTFALTFLLSFSFISALSVDAEYVTLFSGGQESVKIEIGNDENFDIEDIIFELNLANLPFTTVGSSSDSVDEINENDEETVSFTLKATTDIILGDYNIPYILKYTNADDPDEDFKQEGSFGIRVSAKTELDFSIEVQDSAIVGQEGQISLEIINQGLGEIKSISVQIFPQGFELLSKDKIFVGTIDADDTDTASFDIIYKTTTPSLSAKITYKDFDNKDQVKNINLPFKVYTQEEALELGIISKNNSGIYIGFVIVLLVAWFVYRKIRKNRRNNKKKEVSIKKKSLSK